MRGDLPFPVAVLKESALAHNLAWMADFTRATGVLLAPHGKTTMAPQLFARQLEAGAWGITFATMQQASLGVRTGVRRIILANQLVGREDIAHALYLVATTPDLELHVLVDSIAQLRLIEARRIAARAVPGRSTRCWKWGSPEAARAVAALTRRWRWRVRSRRVTRVRLSGVECFEGLNVTGDDDGRPDRGRALPAGGARGGAAMRCGRSLRHRGGHAVGGRLGGVRPRRTRACRCRCRARCARSCGAAATSRTIRSSTSAFCAQVLERSGAAWRERARASSPRWRSGREVQSQPEPGLAILAFGKRDASFDIDLPMPFARVRDRCSHAARRRLAHRQAQRPARLPADSGRRRRRRRRSRRLRDLAPVHDVRQMAVAAGRRRRLRRHRRHPDVTSELVQRLSRQSRSAWNLSILAAPSRLLLGLPPVQPPLRSCWAVRRP